MKITQDTLIADVLKEVPEADQVIFKYFAGACFGCPSFQLETIAEGAMAHNEDPDRIVNEINRIAEQKKAS